MRRIVNADEQDAYTFARRFYCYLARPGVVKKIKKRTHKRERREAKTELRNIEKELE
jgi:hypothetical protein